MRPRFYPAAACMAGLMLLLAGSCDVVPAVVAPDLAERELTTQYRTVSDSKTWVAAPLRLITVERALGTNIEQRVVLANETSLRGENFMLLRARARDGQNRIGFQLEEFVKRAGGVPPPFTSISDNNLLSATDALGTYFWTEYRAGVSTVCVLAVRRLDSGARLLPADTNVLDVMLRNCVSGTVEEALLPITAAHISGAVGSSQTSGPAGIRTLSPLAGPKL